MMVIDGHCDFLSKLLADPGIDFMKEQSGADVSLPRLRQGRVALQFFALYVSEKVKQPAFDAVLEMIELGYRQVFRPGRMPLILWREDLAGIAAGTATGGLLTLEGVDALQGNMTWLRTLFLLGVRMVGITWNNANWAADGVGEPRGGGFTVKGRQMIKTCSELGMLMDVSHLSERGFWELCELYDKPFAASHSNAYSVCPHPRNLRDEQIKQLIARGGMISLTFVPWFVKPKDATVTDVLRHIEHVAALGGLANIGFGSDFDGIDDWIPGLENPSRYTPFAELLCRHYPERDVRLMLGGNWLRFLQRNLPESPAD
jgi:membrane dipeptidase